MSAARTADAAKMRAYRARRRKGVRIAPLAYSDVTDVERLIALGLLRESARDDRTAVAEAFRRLIDEAWHDLDAARYR